MSENETVLTLFSSDSTIQYIKDIFSVLALPRGSMFLFRYDSKYIEPSALNLFRGARGDVKKTGIVAFRSNANTEKDQQFCIPIRWVTIRSIEEIANGWTVLFEVNGYPKFTSDYARETINFKGINQFAQDIFKQDNTKFAVWNVINPWVDLHAEDNPINDRTNWYEIVKRLVLIPKYHTYQFIKCSPLYVEQVGSGTYSLQKKYCPKNGRYTKIVENSCVYFDVEYYAEEYNKDALRKINVAIDDHVLIKANGFKTVLQSRYGTVKLGFQPKHVKDNIVSEIFVSVDSSLEDELESELSYPLQIVKNKTDQVKKAGLTSVGALFVALPGIFSTSLTTGWNVFFAAVGVFILGINTFLNDKE